MNKLKKTWVLFFLLPLFIVIPIVQAQEFFYLGNFNSYTPGPLQDQDNWQVTKYQNDEVGGVNVTTSGTTTTDKFVEIINKKSLIVTKSGSPVNSGSLNFKIRHNKTGLFYFYAQTSDKGGQLLFSIQFTPDNGIILEQADSAITLLPEYNADQWYVFSIDFDNNKGGRGAFTLSIDGTEFGEYAYVKSQSDLFDLAQLTFGSDSAGEEAISAFDSTTLLIPATITSTVSTDLLLLSITLSSTSISSDLDNGLIVTASLDRIASLATSSASDIAIPTSTPEGIDDSSIVGSFIKEIIENVINIFTAEEETPIITTTEPTLEKPSSNHYLDKLIEENEVESSVSKKESTPEIITEANPIPTDEIPNNEINTTEF